MTRMLTLRVPDEQYDWLMERVLDFEGDLSAATRDAIDAARILYRITGALDPHAELQALLDESDRQAGREAYFDEFGRYPEDSDA
jgi:hypothetical protein